MHSADENDKIMSVQQFICLSGVEIQGLFPSAEANHGYFLALFQSLQLPSAQSESTLTLIPLAAISHASLRVCTEL
jgi:hypothetical protein